MDWEQIITSGLIGITITLVFSYMNNGANEEIEIQSNGDIELRMNKFYHILGYLSIGFASIFVMAALYYQDKEMYILGFAMLLLFGGLGLLILMYYLNHKLMFNEDKIIVHNWRREVQEIYWTEITEIKFNAFSGYLKINGRNKNLKIHYHLVGLKEFTKRIDQKTKWKSSNLNLPFK